MKSKTIILSSENQKGRGILTLFQENDLLQCRIRLYNIEKLNRFCKIGIYHEKQVYSANLLEKSGVYSSSMVGNFNIDNDFYTAIIDTSKENEVILSGGTYAGFFFNDQSVFNKFERIEKENPNTNLYDYEETTQPLNNANNELQTENNQCSQPCDKCENCVYKEFFYSHQSESIEAHNNTQTPVETNNKDINNEILNEKSQEENESIIQAILPQFQYVFENYPQDEILNNLIPNSKFVNIKENNENYSIGGIYDENTLKYICYATLCNYNTPAPKELGEHYQWLPLDKEDPLSEGYYIVFQDAQDLKIVEL